MRKSGRSLTIVTLLLLTFTFSVFCWAKPDASTKYSVIRAENPNSGKERLILPYAFPSDSMGTTFGVGGFIKGYHQDQLLLAGTVFGSADDAYAFLGGLWDYRLPLASRL